MRRVAGLSVAALVLLQLPSAVAASGAASPLDLFEVARDLEAVSPEEPGTASAEARYRLVSWMRTAGLEEVETDAQGPPSAASLTGVLRGVGPEEGEREVILVVTVGGPGDPAWWSDARAAATALTAASRLAALPRRHTVRLLLLGRAGGTARAAAGRWVGALSADRRGRLLAVVDLDGIGDATESAVGIVRLVPIERTGDDGLRLTPAWLVHAVLAGGRAVGEPLAVAASRLTPAAQWLARSTAPTEATAGDAFLAAGIPAVSLRTAGLWAAPLGPRSDLPPTGSTSRDETLSRWTPRLTALVRRLDVLAGRPRPDSEYLAGWGRVWSRRDLYWVGLVVWIGLVVSGLPGPWRDRSRRERVARGRRYLPGYAVRGLLLVTLLALPVLSFLLLLPAAVVWVATSWLAVSRRLAVALAAAPWAAWTGGVGWLLMTDRAASFVLGPPALGLLGATFGGILWSITRGEPRRAPRGDHPAVGASS